MTTTPISEKQILINLISDESLGQTEDSRIIKSIFNRTFGFKVNFLWIHINYSEIPSADINIHMGDINHIAFTVAPVNIFIPDATKYQNVWNGYLSKFDYIWCKNANIFDKIRSRDGIPTVSKRIVTHFPWCSRDILSGVENAEIRRHIAGILPLKQISCFVGDNPYRLTPLCELLQVWNSDFMPINIYLQRENAEINRYANSDRGVSVTVGHLSNEDYRKIIARSAYILSVAEIETFPTTISEALQLGRGVIFPAFDITSENRIMNSIYEDVVAGSDLPGIIRLPIAKLTQKQTKELNINSRTYIGPKIRLDIYGSIDVLRRLKHAPIPNSHTLQDLWKSIRKNVFSIQKPHIESLLPLVIKRHEGNFHGNGYNYDKIVIADEDLPTVSIITPTYNRRKLFALAVYNYLNQSYPRDKLEWVILDDTEDETKCVRDLLPTDEKYKIKYLRSPTKIASIGEKRNILTENATGKIIVCMDDDDYYPSESTLYRVKAILSSNFSGVACTTIGSFHISRIISSINMPPRELSFAQRVSEATIAYRRSFWEDVCKWPTDVERAEGEKFIGKSAYWIEIDWKHVIVSLLHRGNMTHRSTGTDEPNGCHFGWSDKLFAFITNLDTIEE